MVGGNEVSDQAARNFLRTGSIGKHDAALVAEACNRLVRGETQCSISKAVDLAQTFVRRVRRREDMPLQLALRSLGWALHVSGRYLEAEKAYVEARSLARNEPVTRGRIDRILIDVYMYLGDFAESRRRARLAISNFRRHGLEEDEAKTRLNYANLFHRQDRHREANREYRRAAAYFERHGGTLMLGLCYYNQANTQVQLFDFAEADRLYELAKQKFGSLGFELYVTECRYGLAWLHMLQGDYHRALSELEACEAAYRTARQPKGAMLCVLDRAEAMLSLNLYKDACDAARVAERQARSLGIHYESAKAAFFLGQACRALGDDPTARAAFTRAERGFVREHNQAFAAAVQLFSLPAGRPGGVEPHRLRAMRQQFARAQLPLWEAVCDLQLLQLLPDDRRIAHRLAKNPAVEAVPHLYSHWHTHMGDLAALRGHDEKATRHWTLAAERLEAVRAKLPPVEMRSTFMRRRTDPYLRLVEKHVGHNPAMAAVWSERYKTAGVWSTSDRMLAEHPVRAQARRSLAELACQVSALAEPSAKTGGRRTVAPAASRRRLTKFQRRARNDLAELESAVGVHQEQTDTLLADIRSASRTRPIVQFHYDKDDLLAFVHEAGSTRVQRFRNGRRRVSEFTGCWNVLLGRGLLTGRHVRVGDLRDERRLFDELGDWLWAPLEITPTDQQVMIVPEGKLWNIPWLAIQHAGLPLASRHSIVLSPSIRHYRFADRKPVRTRRIAVFVGQTEGLSHARPELAALTAHNGHDIRVFDPCRRDDWPAEGSAWIWHYTGHAQFRSDNPFYSSLQLADGPLFAADFRLKQSKVDLVTLAACRTGFQPMLPGEESTGLVRSLLEMGARNVVGSHWTVSDKSTAHWVKAFYKPIFDGLSAADAVRLTALTVREQYPSAYDWAAFSVFGAG